MGFISKRQGAFFCSSASEKQAHIFLFAAVPAQPPDKPGIEQVHGQDGRTPQHRLPGGLLIDQQERVRPGDEPLVIGPEGHRTIEHRGDQRQRNAPRRQLWLPFQQDKGDKGTQRVEQVVVEHGALGQQEHHAALVGTVGPQHEHHSQEGHGQAAGGNVLERLDPAGQLPPREQADHLTHRHQQADEERKDIGVLGVKGEGLAEAVWA